MFEDIGSSDALGDMISSNELTGWDGNWTGGEDFLSGLSSPLAASESLPEAPMGGGALGYTEGSPNVASPSAEDFQTQQSQPGVMDKLGRALGLTNKQGEFDWSDPKTLDKLIKLGIGVGGIANAMSNNKRTQQSQSQNLMAQLQQQAKQAWTPQQAAWANAYFQTPTTPRTVVAGQGGIKSIQPSRGYAIGGPIEGEMESPMPPDSGALGLLEGPGDGQSDSIPIDAARGEYVVDAATVSDIGNGSNEAGAEILRQWTENLRKHKRSVDHKSIPPETKDLSSYLPKGAA
jgi:hypothetical protein